MTDELTSANETDHGEGPESAEEMRESGGDDGQKLRDGFGERVQTLMRTAFRAGNRPIPIDEALAVLEQGPEYRQVLIDLYDDALTRAEKLQEQLEGLRKAADHWQVSARNAEAKVAELEKANAARIAGCDPALTPEQAREMRLSVMWPNGQTSAEADEQQRRFLEERARSRLSHPMRLDTE